MNWQASRKSLAAVAIAWTALTATDANAKVFNDLFLFGDSYTDTGASFPLTNGTTAGAYLATLYGISLTLPQNPSPGTSGVNFAESGARIDVGPTPPATHPLSLTQQVAEFGAYVQSGNVTFNPGSTLFFLLGGLNDHLNATQAQIGAATTAQVQSLYGLGARYFEIALLPSLVSAFADSAANVNPEMRTLVPQLQAMFPDATFVLSNWGGFYDDILTNPQNYGITNTTDPCLNGFGPTATVCSDPDQHFFYYVVHPSDASHRIVGAELFAEALAIPEPMPFALIAIGLAGLAVMRRKAGKGAVAIPAGAFAAG